MCAGISADCHCTQYSTHLRCTTANFAYSSLDLSIGFFLRLSVSFSCISFE